MLVVAIAAVMGEGNKNPVEIMEYIISIWTKELKYVLYKILNVVSFPGNVVCYHPLFLQGSLHYWSDWFSCYASLHCKQNHFCHDLHLADLEK